MVHDYPEDAILKALSSGPVRLSVLKKMLVSSGVMSGPTFHRQVNQLEQRRKVRVYRPQGGKGNTWIALPSQSHRSGEVVEESILGSIKVDEGVISVPRIRIPTPRGQIRVGEAKVRIPVVQMDPPLLPIVRKVRETYGPLFLLAKLREQKPNRPA